MTIKNFWEKLEKPIVGMAPMEGVTNAVFRYVVCKHSRPSFVMTEFTNVEGLARGAKKMLPAFLYDEIERPIVAQLFGVELESFYKAAVLVCELGFDGIDINMGCPVPKIAGKGSGAALIKNPELAKKIIRKVKEGVKDWSEGIRMKKAGVHPEIIDACKKMIRKKVKRRSIPVSIKTRTGYDRVIYKEWTKQVLEEKPAAILMHGRILKQLYRGEADWEILAKAAEICRGSGTFFIGNGDIKSMSEAKMKIEIYGVDGVLVGRAVIGNPWFFGEKEPDKKDRLNAAIEHLDYSEKIGDVPFASIKQHTAWYLKGFKGAKELRMKVMGVENAEEVRNLIMEN